MIVQRFGEVSYEGLNRAVSDFGVDGVGIYEKLGIIHDEFRRVASGKRQQAMERERNKNGRT